MPKQNQESNAGKWIAVVVILLFLSFISFIAAIIIGAFMSASDFETGGNVALIEVKGPIMPDNMGGVFGSRVAAASTITELIEKADKNPEVQAILFEINSPGGTAVATYEIATAIKQTNKTTVAWIRDAGLSGGFWVATACDHVIANPMSMTGSIGVISSYLELSEFLDNHSIKYQRLVAGKYKDIGSPFKPMTPEEEDIMHDNLDKIHTYFINAVAENRGLPRSEVREIAEGLMYLGVDAKELGLVDQLGTKRDAVQFIEKKHNIEADITRYEKQKTFAEILMLAMGNHGFSIGNGVAGSFEKKGELIV